MFLVKCSGCQSQLSVNADMAGKTGKCPKCGTVIRLSPLSKPVAEAMPATAGQTQAPLQPQVPVPVAPRPAAPPATITQPPPTAAYQPPFPPTASPPAVANTLLAPFLNEEQDPVAVAHAYERVQQVVTRGEEILYIAVQKKPMVNLAPDCAILTTRRFIIYRAKLLGRSDFDDYIWRDLSDVRLKEGMLGATLTMRTVRGPVVSIDYLPKLQARKLYRFAQEMEEKKWKRRR